MGGKETHFSIMLWLTQDIKGLSLKQNLGCELLLTSVVVNFDG